MESASKSRFHINANKLVLMDKTEKEFSHYHDWKLRQASRAEDEARQRRIEAELRELSERITQGCEKNEMESVLSNLDMLNQKLEAIDSEVMFRFGRKCLREIIQALDSVNSANKGVILNSLSVISLKNPFIRKRSQ